jgi:tetratricopeptide (TPR) repeat protein
VAQDPSFDVSKAHRYFSADCFNKAWELIENPNRTPADDEQMIRLNQASLWHWTQRDDCKETNMSIGYWQASRIHAILGRAEEARRYGQLCLENSPQESPFLLAYAYEALARAAHMAGNSAMAEQYFKEALRLAENVMDSEDRDQILNDLKTIK